MSINFKIAISSEEMEWLQNVFETSFVNYEEVLEIDNKGIIWAGDQNPTYQDIKFIGHILSDFLFYFNRDDHISCLVIVSSESAIELVVGLKINKYTYDILDMLKWLNDT